LSKIAKIIPVVVYKFSLKFRHIYGNVDFDALLNILELLVYQHYNFYLQINKKTVLKWHKSVFAGS
jgi:hypothetical protein